MKVAHVRERHAPAGSPWRLAAALDGGEAPRAVARSRGRPTPSRRSRPAAGPQRDALSAAADDAGRSPRAWTRGSRRCASSSRASRAGTKRTTPSIDAAGLAFGPPVLRPPSLRDFYAFEGHVRTMWERRGGEVPETWYRLPIFYFSNVSEVRGPDDPIWSPAASQELDYELEVAAVVDTPARDLSPERAEEAIGGYTIFNDWSARDLQREETVGPARAGQGQGLRELVRAVAGDARRAGRRPRRERLRPRDDRRGQRHRDEPRALVRRAVLVRRDARPRIGRRRSCGPATSSAAGRSGPAACSRSATRPSAATSSRATRSSCASSGSARSVTRSSPEAPELRRPRPESIMPEASDIEPMTGRRLAGGPPHLRRGHRDRQRDARARGARLGSFRPLASGRLPVRRPSTVRTAVVGWTALGGYSARTVYAGVAWESVYVAAEARGQGIGRRLLEALIPASEAAGYWTLLAGVLAENAGEPGSARTGRVPPDRRPAAVRPGRHGPLARCRPARTPERDRRLGLNDRRSIPSFRYEPDWPSRTGGGRHGWPPTGARSSRPIGARLRRSSLRARGPRGSGVPRRTGHPLRRSAAATLTRTSPRPPRPTRAGRSC